MKKQAADALKAEKAEARKTEAARKKEAKTVTRKSMSLASKMTTPLGKAWQSGQDVVAKAQQAGVTDQGQAAAGDGKDHWRMAESHCQRHRLFHQKSGRRD